MKKTLTLLPRSEAIFLYFLSLHPPIALNDLRKILPNITPEGRQIADKILNNSNLKYRKPIPECTNMESYREHTQAIDKMLEEVPLYAGGAEAVMGYFKYCCVLTQAGSFATAWNK
jgi:hypothetical protein